MKYILVEMPNEVPDDEVDRIANVMREVLSFSAFDSTVRFGSLFTSQ